MYGKIRISAEIEIKTGMHIGGSNAYSAIGAVDSPVIRDTLTKDPIIPGSSLKGKLRTLLARSISQSIILEKHNNDHDSIKRLFGSSGDKIGDKIIKSRLIFSDCPLKNKDKLKEVGSTEIKFENTIGRIDSVANPRQIERVIRGAIFDFKLVYDIDNKDELEADMKNFAHAIKLLQMDYLGGHGTRGYGKVDFSIIDIEVMENCINQDEKAKIIEILRDVG
ncbi:UNVERIFIED_CONTAM: CRISPR-associated protein Csm3 [Acetivibrio alkalicellulosi]